MKPLSLSLTWRTINKQKEELVTPTGHSLGFVFYNRMLSHNNTYDATINGSATSASYKTSQKARMWVETKIGVQ